MRAAAISLFARKSVGRRSTVSDTVYLVISNTRTIEILGPYGHSTAWCS